jgi:hypothetical protein
VPVAEAGDGDHLGDEPLDLSPAYDRVLDVLGLGIERAEGADHRDEHAHRVRVVAERVENAFEVLVDERVVGDGGLERFELALRGELAVQQEVRRLEVARLLRQLLDRIAAVFEDALVAVDVRDRAAAGGRVHERRVVGHQPEVVFGCFDLAQIGGLDRAFFDGNFVRFASTVVSDGERIRQVTYLPG